MSKPAAGNYYIIQRLLSPTGEKLAITYNGQGAAFNLTPLANLPAQQFSIVDYSDGKTQSVSPAGNLAIQGGPSQGVIMGIPANASVYMIRTFADIGTTILSGSNGPDNWSVATSTNIAKVNWGTNAGANQQWILQKV